MKNTVQTVFFLFRKVVYSSENCKKYYSIITKFGGNKMKDKAFGVLQRVGRSFMLPIALLPVAGLLLGIGSSFTNPTTLET